VSTIFTFAGVDRRYVTIVFTLVAVLCQLAGVETHPASSAVLARRLAGGPGPKARSAMWHRP